MTISHRSRLETCLGGDIPDRVPVALWRHFPVDDQTAAGLAAAVIDFQHTYDFDLVKITPASSFCLKDWGVDDEWRGAAEGTRNYTKRVINQPEDWTRLPVLSPFAGSLGNQLECIRLINNELGSQVPVLQTVFNPLSQAKNLIGNEALLVHIRKYPEAVHAGLRILAETTRRFIEAIVQTGIAGIFYAVQHAQYGMVSEIEYATYGRPYDIQVLEPARGLWLNMLHLHGENVMFNQFLDYPVEIINWHDRDTWPSLNEAQALFPGTVCGGLQRERTMVLGTPESVTMEALDAIQATQGRCFILGTGCVLPIIAPRANIWAARQAVG